MPKLPARLRPTRRWLWAVALALGVWVVFLDSHSLLERAQMHAELGRIERQNVALEAHIAELEAQVEAAPLDETIERIAREQYGMRRPGETVYRVAPAAR